MYKLSRLCSALACLGLIAPLQAVERLVPLNEIPLDSLDAFVFGDDDWQIGGSVAGPMRTRKSMTLLAGVGVVANTASSDEGRDLLTKMEHGDLELSLEFMLPKGGNSGVYFQGRYEVQLADSWLKTDLSFADLGGVCQRWLPDEGKGIEGHAPLVDASRAPGLWQSLQVVFRAPRFDAAGRKIAHARFESVTVNGMLVQRDVEVTGSTRASFSETEVAHGPLMFQGDRGPVAFRNIRYKRTEPGEVTFGPMDYAWYPGGFQDVNDLDVTQAQPLVRGETDLMDPAISGETGQGLIVFNGTLDAPVDGEYGFRVTASGGATQISVDGEVVSHVWRSPVATMPLTAGPHAIETRYIRRWGGGPPRFTVEVEGPEMAPQMLTVQTKAPEAPPQILLDVADRTLVQRGFVQHAGIMRLTTVSVGSPAGLHFSYDLAGGAPLKVWRGDFLDMTKMWHHRGEDQIAIPRGGAIELVGVPTLSQLPSDDSPWRTDAEPALRERGYRIDQSGTPTFTTQLGPLVIEDRISPRLDRSGLHRRLKLTGRSMNHDPRLMIAAGETITEESDGVYVVGDREYYLEWLGATMEPRPPEEKEDTEAEAPMHPELVRRQNAGRTELLIQFPSDRAEAKSVSYNLIW